MVAPHHLLAWMVGGFFFFFIEKGIDSNQYFLFIRILNLIIIMFTETRQINYDNLPQSLEDFNINGAYPDMQVELEWNVYEDSIDYPYGDTSYRQEWTEQELQSITIKSATMTDEEGENPRPATPSELKELDFFLQQHKDLIFEDGPEID
jgi:hypothetical protein